jgi:ATPase subunit of ABC transporter with duplicated ATPase domains
MSDASVVCSNLSFSWPDGSRVFESLSFVFDAGRTGLVAPNGAGKTTLLEPNCEAHSLLIRVRSSWSATTRNSWTN